MKIERKETEIVSVIFHTIVCIVILQYLTGCGNYKMCLSNTSIDEVNEQQKLNKK